MGRYWRKLYPGMTPVFERSLAEKECHAAYPDRVIKARLLAEGD